jgi:thiamine-monophosphate kinase
MDISIPHIGALANPFMPAHEKLAQSLYSSAPMSKTQHLPARPQEGGEAAVVRRIEKAVASLGFRDSRIRLGSGDDAALIKSAKGSCQILTCDWFLEGTHFLRDKHPADSVGWKCLARAVSDVAAMGGVPRCFLLSLALPTSLTGVWLEQFLRGLRRSAKKFSCPLAGGDTTRREDILINVTVLGEVRSGEAVLRSGARAGDVLFVSGRLGEAELGLRLIRNSKRRVDSSDPALRKHLYPEPRLELGRWLAQKRLASAMMDLSDGLSTDLPRLCAVSGVGARVDAAKIHTVRIPRRWRGSFDDPLALALHGGDDYELLFTVPPSKLNHIPGSYHEIPIRAIGAITKEPAILVVNGAGRELQLPSRGWDPFRDPR